MSDYFRSLSICLYLAPTLLSRNADMQLSYASIPQSNRKQVRVLDLLCSSFALVHVPISPDKLVFEELRLFRTQPDVEMAGKILYKS